MTEFVYFLRHKNLTPVKIGVSNQYPPLERMKLCNTFAPYGINLLGCIASENARDLEKELHFIFQEKRLNGEWFNLKIQDLIEIDGIKFEKHINVKRELTKTTYDQFKELYVKSGKNNISQIAKKLGISRQMTHRYKNRYINE